MGAFASVSPNNAPREGYLALFRKNLGLLVSDEQCFVGVGKVLPYALGPDKSHQIGTDHIGSGG